MKQAKVGAILSALIHKIHLQTPLAGLRVKNEGKCPKSKIM